MSSPYKSNYQAEKKTEPQNREVIVEAPANLSEDKIDQLLGVLPEVPSAAQDTTPKAETIQTSNVADNIDARIAQVERQLAELKKGRDGVRLAKATEKVLDWSKITEDDVYDLSIPIKAIEGGAPDVTQVKLLDPSYSIRYVSLHPRILGIRKANGFTYVVKADIDPATAVGLDLKEDENGQYRYHDVVLMKCPKEKYLGQLRRNHERAIASTQNATAHKKAKAQVEADYVSSDESSSYIRYKNANKIDVFVPGGEAVI